MRITPKKHLRFDGKRHFELLFTDFPPHFSSHTSTFVCPSDMKSSNFALLPTHLQWAAMLIVLANTRKPVPRCKSQIGTAVAFSRQSERSGHLWNIFFCGELDQLTSFYYQV